MSSRPALRPPLAAAKDFSHSFNSKRSLRDCFVVSAISPTTVIDILVVVQLAVNSSQKL